MGLCVAHRPQRAARRHPGRPADEPLAKWSSTQELAMIIGDGSAVIEGPIEAELEAARRST
jgi:hypothetical protein